jgi:cellulose synthase/poly-beta-1,6-N-acetylglucosamine synthase-like glycosyltransferase
MNIIPPSDEEMDSYVHNNKWLYLLVGVISAALLVSGGVLFSLSKQPLLFFLPLVLINGLYLFVSYLIVVLGKPFSLKAHDEIRSRHSAMTPKVDVYLPICGEDKDVILNVWECVKKLDYPDFEVHVLDDSKTDAMRKYAEDMGFCYFRREGRDFKKAGNLKHAFHQTEGKYILILDADFAPRPDMLRHMVPYMEDNPKVCIVQTPQYFETSSWMNWIERAAGYVQELFYRLIQQSRDRFGGTICVGSCALYRREALDSIGGPRQIEHSEDVWTGFSMVSKGWSVKYLPLNLSKGRCPEDLRPFFNQQYRWCSGSMSLCFSKEFWASRLTAMQKICYFSGMMYYMASAMGTFLVQFPSIIMVNFFPEKVKFLNIIFYGPSFLFGVIIVWLWSSYADKSFDFLRIRHMSYYAHFYALRDRLLNRTVGWVATGQKTSAKSRFDNYRVYAYWNATLSLLAIAVGIAHNFDAIGWLNVIPPSFFALFNFWLTMSTLRDQ